MSSLTHILLNQQLPTTSFLTSDSLSDTMSFNSAMSCRSSGRLSLFLNFSSVPSSLEDQNRTLPLNILHERSTEWTTLEHRCKMTLNLNQADINYTSNKSGRTKSREVALHSVCTQSQMEPLRSQENETDILQEIKT